MEKFRARLTTIYKVASAREWVLFTDRAVAAAGTEFIQGGVPKMYQVLTDVDLKHRGKHTKSKLKVGKVTVKGMK